VDELGFDDCINYRTTGDMEAAIREKCPEGVDFYFDNVGGEILDAALLNMNKDSTLLFCGTISTYNATEPVPGPYNYWQILAKTITVKGYLISDHFHRVVEGQEAMSQWLKEDKIKFREHINEGIENCLDTYNLLFTGGNDGKLMLKL
jgi:NADPH-dependent curcumin reductase CurA